MRPSIRTSLLLALLAGLGLGCGDDISQPGAEPPADAEPLATTTAPLARSATPADLGLLPLPDRSAGLMSSIEASAAPDGKTYALVFVHPEGERAGAQGAPVVADFGDAVARVESGGTIRVFAGTYGVTQPVRIDKRVTIEPMSGAEPVVVNETGDVGWIVAGPEAVVTIEGLRFENPGGHSSVASEAGAQVLVRSSAFHVAEGVAGVFAWMGSRMVVEESEFTGGLVGVFASQDDTELVVRGSRFRGHEVAAVQHQEEADGLVHEVDAADCGTRGCARNFGGEVDVVENRFSEERTDVDPFSHHIVLYSNGTGRIEGNVFDGCGHGDCVLAIRRADVAVVGNEFTIYEEHDTRFAVAGSDGTGGTEPDYAARAVAMLVADNVITGVGGSPDTDPGDPDAYAIKEAAIMIENAGVSRVFRNQITNARSAFGAFGPCEACDPSVPEGATGGVFADGGDNVADLVMEGVRAFNESAVTIRSSDFTRYATALVLHVVDPGASDLTCNWWGSVLGPRPVDGPADPGVYTPWALEPVAGSSATTCDGGPPAVIRVEAGVTDLTTSPLTLPTVPEASEVVASGGTILVADGTHAVRELSITRPVTVEAEGPGRPVIDALDATGAFRVDAVTGGLVALRGLEIVNGREHNIQIFGRTFDRVLIEDNVLHAAAGSRLSSAIFSLSATGNEVVIRENRFVGGQVGIHADFSNAVIEQNEFTGQAVNAVRFGSGATNLRIAGNTVACGTEESCIALVPVGDVAITSNVVTANISDPMEPAPIQVQAASAVLTGNTVTGVGGVADPADPASFAIRHAAIDVNAAEDAVVTGNEVRNAWIGIVFGAGVGMASGQDNVVDGTSVPLVVEAGAAVAIHSSDFTGYARALDVFDASNVDLSCNWWGDESGPVDPNTPDAGVYIPWATATVVGTGTMECDGAPPEEPVTGVSELCLSGSFQPKPTVKVGLSFDPTDGTTTHVANTLHGLGFPPTTYTDAAVASGQPTADGVTVLVISRKVTKAPVSDAYLQGVRDFIANGGSVMTEYDGAALVFSDHAGDNPVMANMTPSLDLFTGTVDGGGALYPLEQSKTYVSDAAHPIMEGLPSEFLVGFRLAFASTGFNADWLHETAHFVSVGGLDLVPEGTYPAVLAGRCGPSRVVLFNLNYFNVGNQEPVDRMIVNAFEWLAGL